MSHVITPEVIERKPSKIKTIIDHSISRNSKEIGGFLGSLGYYSKLIKYFRKKTKPPTISLIMTGKPSSPRVSAMNPNVQTSFDKQALLQPPDFTHPLNLKPTPYEPHS